MKKINLTVNQTLFASLLTLLMGLTTSCADEMAVPSEHPLTTPEETNLSAALRIADEFFAQIEPGTRAVSRNVSSVEKMQTAVTRNGESDTDIYLINYADNQGFAMMDVRPGQEEIYAISPTGHLSVSDTIGNPVLKEFFEGVSEYSARMDNSVIGMPTLSRYYVVKEFCKNNLNDWAESWTELASDNAITLGGINRPCGTAAVAVAKIMSYFKYPTKLYATYTPYELNWDQMLNARQKDVKNTLLLYLSWFDVYLNCEFNTNFTETNPNNLDYTFRNLGYGTLACNGEKWSIRKDMVKNYLRSGYGIYKKGPVIGYAAQTDKPGKEAKNRFWIIDGFVDRVYYNVTADGTVIKDLEMIAPTLLHCIWGDGVSPDGYFAYIDDTTGLDKTAHQDTTIINKHFLLETNESVSYTFKNLKIYGGWYFK